MRRLLIALFATALASPAFADEAALNAVIRDYDAYVLTQSPGAAAREGDRSALARLSDPSLAADQQRRAAYQGFADRLRGVDPVSLGVEARLNRDVLTWTLERRLRELAFDEARMPFNSDSGFDLSLDFMAGSTRIESAADAEAWIARLRAAPRFYRAHMENLRRGIGSGFTQPRITVEQVIERARAAAARTPADEPLLKPFDEAKLTPEQKASYRAQAEAVIREQVAPARREFLTLLETSYLPAARRGLGVRAVPGGEAYYRWLVADHTTTKLTPDEIHELGRAEVARIKAEMQVAMRETGFTGEFPAFVEMLRKDPRFYVTTREELLEKAAEISKRVDDKLPRWFNTQPRLTFGIRPVPREIEEGYTTGRYSSGSPRQGIAGGYLVNTSHLDQRPLFELPALTFHESQPGHHLQIALAQELQGVPAFRRNAGVTAFTEGWGLYSEKLGGEMGLYRDAYERVGQLSFEMWRACRLVADTGIHWKGWTYDQAKACFSENTALAPINIDVELRRYISWPGQALAYKVGELTILRLREKARTALGEKFDIRRFHDVVLLAGPLPLDLLESRVDAWIVSQQAAI